MVTKVCAKFQPCLVAGIETEEEQQQQQELQKQAFCNISNVLCANFIIF